MVQKLGILAAAAAAVAVFALVSSATSSNALTGPGVITISQTEVKYKRVDLGKRGLSAGDIEVSRALLFNRRIAQKPLGHSEVVCTFTGGTSRNCSGTFFLPRGKIVVGGAILYRPLFQLAVLGGTDLYDNVRGTLTATAIGVKPRRDVLVFRVSP